jgi:hypothetical protein
MNVCGSGMMHMEGVLLAAYVGLANRASTEVIDVFIDLNKGTVYLSSELFPFLCMYIVLHFSPFLLYTSIHGLTRCIQQDGPSVRLILTDHGLDRMFWEGKGAFILGCTSSLKAIMIDQPGMGKVNN